MNLSGLSGLAAAYPGFLEGRVANDKADMADIQLSDAQRSQAARIAMGNALQLLAGGNQQQAPAPGQPSTPAAPPPPGPPGQPPGPPQPMAGPPPQMQGGPPGMPPQGPPGMPPQGPPGMPQAQPQMPMRPPAPPVGVGGAPGPGQPPTGVGGPAAGSNPQLAALTGMSSANPRQGALDWRSLVEAVKRANPGIKPDVLMEAVNQFTPLMSMQSKQEWQQVSLQLREQAIQQRESNLALTLQSREREGDKNRDTRKDVVETQQEGATQRANLSAKTREEVAKLSAETRKELGLDQIKSREEEGSKNRASREDVANKNRAQREQQFQQRETRLQESLKLREDSTWARLEQQKTAAAERAKQSKDKQSLVQWRALLDQQDKHIRTRIQAYSANSTQKPAERAAMLKEADDIYNRELEEMRTTFGRSTDTGGVRAPGEQKQDERAPGAVRVPKVGDEQDGYIFQGGNPADQNNWKKKE